MIINLGAYATEIVRAGVQSVPAGQIEVGLALGLKRLQIYRLIVLFPAIKAVFPALASQFILLLLGSSVVSAISANELTAIANTLQSTTFRAFEVYIVVTLMYLAIAVAFRGLFALIYWTVFVRGREALACARSRSTISCSSWRRCAGRSSCRCFPSRSAACSAASSRCCASPGSRRCVSRPPATCSCSRARRC